MNWHGQDTKETCAAEGYAQMEWTGRFTRNTVFRVWKERPDLGTFTEGHESGQSLWDRAHEINPRTGVTRWDELTRFTDDLTTMTKPPSTPGDALRLADSFDAYYQL